MKRLFVAAIIIDNSSEVLMVKRSRNDVDLPGLWTLPGGEQHEGEDEHQAIYREVIEETNIAVRILDTICKFERSTWSVTIYSCQPTGDGIIHNNDPDIEEVCYFPFSEIPERAALEAITGMLTYQAQHNLLTEPYFRYLEKIFSSIFHSHLFQEIDTFNLMPGIDLIKYILDRTPYRNFKSAIPFLLCDSRSESKLYAMLAEVLFAIFTILDDVCDQEETRYGNPTALRQYGLASNAIVLFTAATSLNKLLQNKVAPSSITRLLDALRFCGIAQQQRFLNNNFEAIDYYLEISYQRTYFVQEVWTIGLESLELSEEARMVQQLYPVTAKLGQIVNDYYDTVPLSNVDARDNVYFDVKKKTISFYTLKLLDAITAEADRELFFDKIWGSQNKIHLARLDQLIEKYEIQNKIRADTLDRAGAAIKIVNDSQISAEKKELLKSWISAQFLKLVDPNVEKNKEQKLLSLVRAVNKLTFDAGK